MLQKHHLCHEKNFNFIEFNFFPILGYSGSNKSNLLKDLELIGEQALSFEQLIGIDGACLAPITKDKILSTSIEDLIIQKLNSFDKSKIIYIEWKSPDVIGFPLPEELINKIRSSFAVIIDDQFDKRINNILSKYSIWNDHLDLILSKIDPLKNKKMNFPQDLFKILENTNDVKQFVHIFIELVGFKV